MPLWCRDSHQVCCLFLQSFCGYLKWINFRVDKISRIDILDFSRGQNFANRGVPKISRGQNFAKRGSFKFRDFAILKILYCCKFYLLKLVYYCEKDEIIMGKFIESVDCGIVEQDQRNQNQPVRKKRKTEKNPVPKSKDIRSFFQNNRSATKKKNTKP